MSRSIVLSNGELCVALDERALVRDIYFPHVGYEDHVRGHYIHRVGVWSEEKIAWLGDEGWDITIKCEDESLASDIVATHAGLEVELHFTDIVYNERPVFLRKVTIKNLASRDRDIKLYFGHQFEIYKSHGGDTAYFDPITHSIIHYKGRRVFLMSAILDEEPFQDYAIGLSNFDGKEGTHKDAEDGALSKNPIEHGPVDSVMGIYGHYAAGQTHTCYYSIAAAKSISEAIELNEYIAKKTPEHLVRTASDYWRAWVSANRWNFHGLSSEQVALFKRSLMYVRAHVDDQGGILASVDSDMLQHGLDTYSYVWPRDAAFAALALDHAGDTNVAKRFFEFCQSVITNDGYFMHKYLPDGSLGSSWHPWIRDGQYQLPIQEDETALVVIAMREHYKRSRDLEFLEKMFNPLVEKAAEFMLAYRDPQTKLPQPSYDVWEERRGQSAFTASAVYGALTAAADLSKILGKASHEARYRQGAADIAEGILAHLWDDAHGHFARMLNRSGETIQKDPVLDSASAYGVFAFGVLPPGDPKLASSFEKVSRDLSHGIPIGGLARYEGDEYYRSDRDATGNPWIVTTLWYAEYLIANAKTDTDFARVRDIFSWVCKRASDSGVLPEQFDPKTGQGLSATPLMWSHAAYVIAILKYLDRLEELGISKARSDTA